MQAVYFVLSFWICLLGCASPTSCSPNWSGCCLFKGGHLNTFRNWNGPVRPTLNFVYCFLITQLHSWALKNHEYSRVWARWHVPLPPQAHFCTHFLQGLIWWACWAGVDHRAGFLFCNTLAWVVFLFSSLGKTDLAKVCKAEDSLLAVLFTLWSSRKTHFPGIFNYPNAFMVVSKYLGSLGFAPPCSVQHGTSQRCHENILGEFNERICCGAAVHEGMELWDLRAAGHVTGGCSVTSLWITIKRSSKLHHSPHVRDLSVALLNG